MSRAALLAFLVVTAGCDDDASGEEPCIPDEEPPACQPLYPPTFENLHARTLAPKCSPAGGSCHASDGAQGGLVLEAADEAFAEIRERLVAGAPDCSLVVERLTADDPALLMPPGAPLSEAEACVFRHWIYAGAER